MLKDGERNWEGGRKGCESWEAGLESVAGRDGVRWRNGRGSLEKALGLQKEGTRKGTQEEGIVASV